MAFIEMLLGFVPFVATVLVITALVVAATKLFPAFGMWFESGAMFGTTDRTDNTIPSRNNR